VEILAWTFSIWCIFLREGSGRDDARAFSWLSDEALFASREKHHLFPLKADQQLPSDSHRNRHSKGRVNLRWPSRGIVLACPLEGLVRSVASL
jgi:hypothetical protein